MHEEIRVADRDQCEQTAVSRSIVRGGTGMGDVS